MIFGQSHQCWRCDYSGRFKYSKFFVAVMSAIIAWNLIFGYFVVFHFREIMRFDQVKFDAYRILGGFGVGLIGLTWIASSYKTFFSCPKCHMPLNNENIK